MTVANIQLICPVDCSLLETIYITCMFILKPKITPISLLTETVKVKLSLTPLWEGVVSLRYLAQDEWDLWGTLQCALSLVQCLQLDVSVCLPGAKQNTHTARVL